MPKFTTKFGTNGLKVYSDGIFMGTMSTICSSITFSQWSNDGQIYDKELAKQFLKEEYGYTEFNVTSGQSTKTQVWFKIEAK